MMKKVFIKTYGCQMNVYDSVRMKDVLAGVGYEETLNPADADLHILNTCHIREKAAEKVYSELGRLRVANRERVNSGQSAAMIAVGGCVAQAEGEVILTRAPYVDIVMGSQSYHHLPRLIVEAQKQQRGVVELDFPEVQKFDLLPEQSHSQGISAFLSVQEGCDKFCTFCVVPYTRGAEYSRSMATVLEEARRFVEQNGAIEITLLGQNVNAYHGDNGSGGTASLAELIERMAELDGLQRIRYMTSHPCDMTDDLIAVHGRVEKLMPYLHLPVQSGSDAILKRMNRKHTAAHYLEIIDKLRAVRPDIAFSSDFIIGFPGETEDDFVATMKLVESVGFAQAYSFAYSPRPGTPAAELSAQVAEADKQERLQRLQALITRQQHAFNLASVGQRMAVLLQRDGKRDGQLIGKSPYMQSVFLENASHLRDAMVEVDIVGGYANSLTGVLVNPDHYAMMKINQEAAHRSW
ncbi:MAG: tRNA (N6-isopentenyl adenosine(37)-C2)-methylthiotransferase MiaB [Rickettsiales bacterium]|nr:tRNA (N6-isopentenyl adenosine(37)-C2)-methylthiotransferase MiaB [Rickettsiales bacterium]